MRSWLLLLALLLFAGGALGCTPKIGASCNLSTDCSAQGTRVCDTSQPGGYCTVLNCAPDLCPDEAACVLFYPQVSGCAYNDRIPSREGLSYCMKQCHSNSDCRSDYICVDPRQAPWDAVILDDDQTQHICIYPPVNGVIGGEAGLLDDGQAPVCQAAGPDVGGIDAEITYSADTGVEGADASDAPGSE
jgi:hypothetical protein